MAIFFIAPAHAVDKDCLKKKSAESVANIESQAQTFNVTVTVKYSGVTLQQLAEKEKQIKEVFGEQPTIQMEFEHSCPSCGSLYWNGSTTTLTPNIIYGQ